MKTICSSIAIVLISGSLALAQGYPPGVNPSNPNDMTRRNNPNDMTLPGASNPQDLVRSPSLPKPRSSAPNLQIASPPPLSSALAHTHTDQPVKKFPRHKRRVPEPGGQ
ncbi:MAG TPA: hypothetical protein VIY51_06475 [Xanthobacteraceae bacterium]